MAHTQLVEYSDAQQQLLLALAQRSVEIAVNEGRRMPVTAEDYEFPLQQNRATFVTLTIQNKLRGCIGCLDAIEPLVAGVVHNAYSAAVCDPRFNPVRPGELAELHFEISILSPVQPIVVDDESQLLAVLVPNVDGLILEDGMHRATYLPTVWTQLPQAETFLCELKAKAGLPADYWSESIKFWRYTTETFD